MNPRRFLIVVVAVCALMVFCASYESNAEQSSVAPSPQMRKDVPYHSGGDYKPEATATNRAQVTPVADHNAYPQVPLAKIEILPSAITISGSHYNQRLVVEGTFTDGHQEDLTSQAALTSSNPKVARINNDFAMAEGDGQATVTATVKGRRASVPFKIEDFTAPAVWSFRNDVQPVLTKMGCNSGPCHGAAAGKNGFKLTLRGYDPDIDYMTLTHQALARRTERLEPAKSLILLKPTLSIPHGGGRRFAVDSPEYRVVSGWIAQGMPAPLNSDARVTQIDVLPQEASLRPGAEQQLAVTATFSDGRKEDVTRWAKYDSGNEGVATVDNYGHVIMHSFGEAPVTVWYQSHVTFSRLRIPYPYKLEEAVFQNAPRHSYIDDDILHHLGVLHIPPSPPAGDTEFIRRAYLDSAGILPTPAEVEQFLKDPAPDKRDRLIDAIMK
ncbi:MAG: Ig-like domain-containing protein, partial [Acidobacteriota bacterium]|nr:Ig-like domain-containing protein [Acidobacteriota bacterium]